MAGETQGVQEAIRRWEEKGLIDADLASRLREEAGEAAKAGAVRLSQYVVASVAAVVLLLAAGVFMDWAWPLMAESTRAGFLLVLGVGVHLGGLRMDAGRRWIPAALLMQTAGLALMLGAFLYSERAWADTTALGVAMGLGALAVPILLAPRSIRAHAVMPAIHLCFALGFLAVFLDRATPLSNDAIVWVLDGTLLVLVAVMVVLLRGDPSGTRHPWALNAFVASVYAAGVLVTLTTLGPLDLGEAAVWGMDLWLLVLVGLTLWGIHRSPPGLRQGWFEDQLAYSVLLWIPLGAFTAMEVLDGPSELFLLLVGGVGVAGFVYALRRRIGRLLYTSAFTFVVALWGWAVDRGGALGAVVGLGVAAILLFRLSGRVGAWAGEGGEDGA